MGRRRREPPSPVGGEREEESGWGKEKRVEAEAGGGNIFVWPDFDEEPEKPRRSRKRRADAGETAYDEIRFKPSEP